MLNAYLSNMNNAFYHAGKRAEQMLPVISSAGYSSFRRRQPRAEM
jgi:hypothetical protein